MSRESRKKQMGIGFELENLETRTLMTVGFSRGVLNIRGTRQNDVIEVRRSEANPNLFQVVENGRVVLQRNLKQLRQIKANTQAGDDTLKINESLGKITAPVVFNGGDGNDSFIGGSGLSRIDGGRGRNIVHQSPALARIRNAYQADDVVRFGSTSAFRDFLATAGRSRARIGSVLRVGLAPVTQQTPVASPIVSNDSTVATKGSASQTNTQVAGIDEADIIENDGSNLYILSRGELLIVDATNPDAPVVASRTVVDGYAQSEYLYEGRLTVISTVWGSSNDDANKVVPMLRVRGGSQVQVTVFDVSDVSSPQVISKTQVDGWYSDSRMVDGKLALIVQNDLLAGYWGGFGDVAVLRIAAGSSMPNQNDASLVSMIQKSPIESLLPGWTNQTYSGTPDSPVVTHGLINQPAEIYCPVIEREPNISSILMIDTTAAEPSISGATSIVGSYTSSIYMNSRDLYVFSPRWDDPAGDRTGVQRFDISGQSPVLMARGSFDGHLLNQFSADAKGDLLRVATTRWTTGGTTNAVTVLSTEGNQILPVGAVNNIAPGESITSVRFVDDTAYVVTFRQVDPLFTIDLSQPTAPKIVGELKIPGFSRFLQPLGEGYLLGIGRDADPATGRTLGLKASLFDVRDSANPKEVATFLISQPAEGWSWSAAEWDHHALGYFPELGVIAVPVQGYVQSSPSVDINGKWVAPEYRSDLVILKIDTAGSISQLGTVDHNSSLLRSSRIGDVIYSIADIDLKAVEVLAGSLQPRGTVELQKPYENGDGGVILF